MTRAAPAHYVWWLAGRSAGVVALLLVAGAVILGLALAARVLPTRMRRDAMRAHQHIALIALAAIAAHGAFLAADPWLKAGPAGVVVPFAIPYRTLWTGLGVLAAYLAAVLALSFYVRRFIGPRLWRRMHRLTVLVYVLGLGHALGAGTDAATPVVRYAMLATALPVLALFALRVARSGRRRSHGARAPRGAAPVQRDEPPIVSPAPAAPPPRLAPALRARAQ